MQKKNKTKQIILFLSLVVIFPISNFLKNNTKPKQIILIFIIPAFLTLCLYASFYKPFTDVLDWISDWIVKSMELDWILGR